MPLSNPQIRYLRRLCHHLKPVIQIGQNGLSKAVLQELESTITHHELIKIKISNCDKTVRKNLAEEICEKIHAESVQKIGQMLSLYRRNEQSKKINFSKH